LKGEEKINRRNPTNRDRIPRDWGYHLGIAHIIAYQVVRLCLVLNALIPTDSEESEMSCRFFGNSCEIIREKITEQ